VVEQDLHVGRYDVVETYVKAGTMFAIKLHSMFQLSLRLSM